MEDVKTTQEIINDVNKYEDISKEIKFDNTSNKNVDKKSLPKNLDKFASIFDVMEKKQIFGDTNNQHENLTGVRSSKLMKDFMKAKQKKEINKPKDEAPVTISNNYKIQRFNKPDDIIRRSANPNFNLNLPNNLNLINIAQFETMNIPMENYLNEEQEENYLPLSNNNRIYADDTQNYQTPIDILKNQNIKNTNNQQNNYANSTNNSYNNFNNNNNNYAAENKNIAQINNANNNNNNARTVPEVPIPQVNSNNITAVNKNVNNNPKPIPVQQNKAKNIPVAPPVKLPEKKTVTPKVKFTGKPSDGKNDLYNDSNKKEEIKEVEKINESRGGLLEALKSDNPMARLRKSGTIPLKVSESIIIFFNFLKKGLKKNNAPEKKEDKKEGGEKKNVEFFLYFLIFSFALLKNKFV